MRSTFVYLCELAFLAPRSCIIVKCLYIIRLCGHTWITIRGRDMEFFPSSCDALKQACMLIRLFFVGANVSLGISLVLWHLCCTYSCTYIYIYIYMCISIIFPVLIHVVCVAYVSRGTNAIWVLAEFPNTQGL